MRMAQEVHSLSWATSAAGSSPTGVTLRLVTPASAKAAIRSLTYDAGPTKFAASSHSTGTSASASFFFPDRYRSWISAASFS